MALGSRPPSGTRGSVDVDQAEQFEGDPSMSPGLPRPVGWRVRTPDGTAAYYKEGVADTDWITLSAGGGGFPGFGAAPPAVAAASAAGTSGTASRADHTHQGVASVTAGTGISVTGTADVPIISASGTSFPGFGGAPPAVAAASAAGIAASASRSDHTHQGVASVTAGTGLANSGTATDPVLDVSSPFPGFGAAPPAVAAASDAGVAATTSRSDHTHQGVAGFGSAPPAVAAAGAAGAASTASRSDHTHQGVASVNAGTGINVTGTADAPIVNATATSFPGFGGAPPAAAAASAGGAAGTASRSDHTHAAALEAGSYTPPVANQAGGVLQQSYTPTTATVAVATMPAGRVPAGLASGAGGLRTDDKVFYYEASGARPRLNVNQDSALSDETNVDAAILIAATPASAREAVLQLQGNDASTIRAYQTSDGVLVGNIHFQDGADGASSGSIQFNTRQSTGGGGATLECFRGEGGGLIAPNGPITIGNTGINQTESGKSYLLFQEHGTPGVSNSGQAFMRYRTTGGGGNDWMQLSVSGGSYADMARAGQGTGTASGSTLTLPSDGTYIHVTGTTTINYLTTARVPPGHPIILYFESALTLTNNAGSVPGGTLALQLAGALDASVLAGSKICLVRDSTQSKWVELWRSDP